jgi:hypothetical protein
MADVMKHDPFKDFAQKMAMPGIFYSDEMLHVLFYIHTEPIFKRFSPNEWCLLLVLVRVCPGCATREELLSCLTSYSLDECRQRLLQVKLSRPVQRIEVQRELSIIWNTMNLVKKKIQGFGLTVISHREEGYALKREEASSRLACDHGVASAEVALFADIV